MMKSKSPTDTCIGACIICFNKDKTKVVLGKRKNSYKAGWYGLPGGRVELTEPLLDCAIRELKEETAIDTQKLDYLGVIRELQETYNFIHFAFVCNEYIQEPKLTEPEKCEGWEWFDVHNIPQNTVPGHKAAIEMITKQTSTLVDIV